jgi:hypothetical protein
MLFEAERWIRESRAYCLSVTGMRVDASSPLSALALFMAVAAARYFGISAINDSSAIWRSPEKTSSYDTIRVPEDLQRLRISGAETFESAIAAL